MESDAQKILDYDEDTKFLRSIGCGRYDNEQGVRFHLERAAIIREQIRREVEQFSSK